tara:strand:+ start:203 stop:448 length:246 start_codon:yes stop_codon:yes gene_type:complete
MDEELEQSFKDIINNLICISKEKDLEIMDLKEKLKRERYLKRFNNKKNKKIEYENMILTNKIKSIKEKVNNVNDDFNVSFS